MIRNTEVEMPLARYFLSVGGTLLALLFALDAYLPKEPVAKVVSGGFDPSSIRIHSDRKWPERVVFDTSHPPVVPVQTANVEANRPPVAVAEVSAEARARASFAQLLPPDQKQAELSAPKKPEKKPVQKRRIAKRHAAPPMMLVAQQPQFGFFGNNTW
jgi:hypothetical protein